MHVIKCVIETQLQSATSTTVTSQHVFDMEFGDTKDDTKDDSIKKDDSDKKDTKMNIQQESNLMDNDNEDFTDFSRHLRRIRRKDAIAIANEQARVEATTSSHATEGYDNRHPIELIDSSSDEEDVTLEVTPPTTTTRVTTRTTPTTTNTNTNTNTSIKSTSSNAKNVPDTDTANSSGIGSITNEQEEEEEENQQQPNHRRPCLAEICPRYKNTSSAAYVIDGYDIPASSSGAGGSNDDDDNHDNNNDNNDSSNSDDNTDHQSHSYFGEKCPRNEDGPLHAWLQMQGYM